MTTNLNTPNEKSLVLILGAGASREVNLPVGIDLKRLIANRLDIRFEKGYEQDRGDGLICQSFRLLAASAKEGRGDINPLLHVSWRIRDAMPQAISIDNFIDSHRDDERIALCGKLAITRCILQAEAASSLVVDRSNIYNKLNFSTISDTWFNAFFQLLTENCQKSELPSRLQAIAVVSFNYDRCFEHYLYLALQNYYSMTAEEAVALMKLLEVHHPYGKVGALPWMTNDPTSSIEYGGNPDSAKLIALSKGLRTFTEGTDPSVSDIEQIRATVAGAERLMFLGFAFHRLNLNLLFPALTTMRELPATVFATAYGISQSDTQQILEELANKAGHDRNQIHIRTDLTCAALLREYWRSLSLN